MLNPLPGNDFDVSLSLPCPVDAKAGVCLRQSSSSLPARYPDWRLSVRLGAELVLVLDAGAGGAEHVRSLHQGSEDLVLGHYLEVLTR